MHGAFLAGDQLGGGTGRCLADRPFPQVLAGGDTQIGLLGNAVKHRILIQLSAPCYPPVGSGTYAFLQTAYHTRAPQGIQLCF